jgi:hypothetical protein
MRFSTCMMRFSRTKMDLCVKVKEINDDDDADDDVEVYRE